MLFAGRLFQYAALFYGFIALLAVEHGSNSKTRWYAALGLVAVFVSNILLSSLWGISSPFISVVYYLYLPAYALMLFLYVLGKIGSKVLLSSLFLSAAALLLFCYYYMAVILLSRWEMGLPLSTLVVDLGIYASMLSIFLGSIYGLTLRKCALGRLLASVTVSSLVLGPLIAVGALNRRILNYLSLYILEVFGLPLSLSLVIPFLATLLLALVSIMVNVGRENFFSCGFSLILLGGYNLNVAYYPLLWITGFSALTLMPRRDVEPDAPNRQESSTASSTTISAPTICKSKEGHVPTNGRKDINLEGVIGSVPRD